MVAVPSKAAFVRGGGPLLGARECIQCTGAPGNSGCVGRSPTRVVGSTRPRKRGGRNPVPETRSKQTIAGSPPRKNEERRRARDGEASETNVTNVRNRPSRRGA